MSVWKSWRLTLYSPKNKFSLQKRLQNQISCFWHEWKWQIFSSQLSEAGRRENIAKIYDRDRCCHICHRLSLTFSFSLWWTPPPSPSEDLVEKPLLWRMSWPLPIEVVGRWLLEGLWSQISASPPVYPGASAPPRISNFFLSKYWQLPVMLYNIEVERLFCPNNPSWLWVLVPSAKVFFFATQLSSSPRIVLSPQYNFKFIEGPNIF